MQHSLKIDIRGVQFDDDASSREREDVPLIGTRGYYLHLSNDTCIYGQNWGRLENERRRKAEEMEHDGEEEEAEEAETGHKRWQGRTSVSDEELEQLVGLPMEEFLRGRRHEGEEEGAGEGEGQPRGNLYTVSEVLEEHESVGGGQRAGAGPFLARIVQVRGRAFRLSLSFSLFFLTVRYVCRSQRWSTMRSPQIATPNTPCAASSSFVRSRLHSNSHMKRSALTRVSCPKATKRVVLVSCFGPTCAFITIRTWRSVR
jgi:hypothetical protein